MQFQYLNFILENEKVKKQIHKNEKTINQHFRETFSVDSIYKLVIENLASLIDESDPGFSYNNIKNFARDQTLLYLKANSVNLSKR